MCYFIACLKEEVAENTFFDTELSASRIFGPRIDFPLSIIKGIKDLTDSIKYESRTEKTGLRGFRPCPTQTGLCSHRRWLEAWNFGFRKKRDCTIRVAKTKALISFAVTAKLICVFVFAYAKSRFSQNEAHMILSLQLFGFMHLMLASLISAALKPQRKRQHEFFRDQCLCKPYDYPMGSVIKRKERMENF